MANQQSQREHPKMVICRPPEDESESDEEEYEDNEILLNKTLPSNFKFSLQKSLSRQIVSMNNSPTNDIPLEMGSPTNRSRAALKRGKPVNASKKPDVNRYRPIGNSDPFLCQEAANVYSPEESFEDHENELSDSLRSHLRLPPSRTQSLNQPKSPRSPRISSPSPCGSPRTWSPSISNFERFSHGRRSEMRRWSLVSQSSGYTTGSPASLSSYPSQEHIHQEPTTVHSQLPTTPTPEDFAKLRRHFRSDSSGSSSIHIEDDQHHSAVHRGRARSLSPERSPRESYLDLDDTFMIFREKYPRAKLEMENQLLKFLNQFSETKQQFSDSNVNFACQQIQSFLRDLLYKSQNDLLSREVFITFSENILQAVTNVRERNGAESPELKQLVRRMIAITSRVARLVEISEFDPTALSTSMLQLTADENSDWLTKLSSSHMPYILNRLNKTLENSEDNQSKTIKERPSSLHLSLNQAQPKNDDFERIKIISNGAYGAVYLVRHKRTRMRFAMKEVSKRRMIMKKQVQQVFNERDILTFADNPFVVSMLCTFETKYSLCMVMEYVEGGDVATLLKNIGSLSWEMARMYFAETVLALEYIHSHGIIHRDLKPDNLLITSEGHIKLTDFGLSKIGLTNYTAHVIEDGWYKDYQFVDQEVYGTPDYIAPEVILGIPYGFPVDWWSMGVILYEMVMGMTPFNSVKVQDLFKEITDENLEITFPLDEEEEEDVPEEARDLIRKLLCHDPQMRLGSTSAGGVAEVKNHCFFYGLDWTEVLRTKAEFIPQLRGEEDTSYFDTRSDRYSHEFASDEEDGDLLEQPFENFSSTTPRMSSYLDETFRLSIPDRACKSKSKNSKDTNRDSGIVETAASNILNKPIVILHETNENSEADEEESVVTNIDDANFDDEPTTPSNGSITPSAPTSVTPSEDDTPLSPDHSNDEKKLNIATSGEKESPSTPRRMAVTPVVITKDRKGFGMQLKPIRVYIGDSNNYRMHYIIHSIDRDGPAWKAGLRTNMLVTHINGEIITGLQHVQVVSLMFKKSSSKKERNNSITVHTIPLDQTYIRSDGRKRLPWLGRHVGKFLRKQSSRVKKKPSFFRRFKNRTVDVTQSFSIPSNSSSPKISSSPRRSESMKDRMSRPWRKGGATPRRKQTPVSPLARSTSPVALSSVMTPNSSPPGSIQNLNSTTPPNSPPTTHKERHSMFAESSLLTHQKSVSSSELFLSTTKKNTSPQTSPLLKRAVSPSPDQQHKVHKSRWSNTLERSTMPRAKKTTGSNSVSFIM